MESDTAQNGSTLPNLRTQLAFLRRRRWLAAAVFLTVFALSVFLAFALPAVYRSEATILIEQSSIPDDVVPTTVNSYVEEQIQIVAQRVLVRSNIVQIIEEFDLYPELRSEPRQAAILRFRSDAVSRNQVYRRRFSRRTGADRDLRVSGRVSQCGS